MKNIENKTTETSNNQNSYNNNNALSSFLPRDVLDEIDIND